jgi:Carboxypeptidase regulatory-like domain
LRIGCAAFALSIVLAFSFAGCTKKQSEVTQPPEPTAVVDPSTAGSITGTVRFEGTPPVFRPIDMSAEAACVQANPKPIAPPVVVLGEHGALANVVVYVKSGLGSYHFDTPKDPAVLDQVGCMYEPRVLAMMTNQPFEVKNTDPTTHNVHPIPRENRPWNRSIAAGEAPYVTTFSQPELAIPIVCNIHPWMRAYLFVFAHPYFDVTAKTGTFELRNLPPGTYTIEAWHERFGTQDVSVTVAPKESQPISFTFKTTEAH